VNKAKFTAEQNELKRLAGRRGVLERPRTPSQGHLADSGHASKPRRWARACHVRGAEPLIGKVNLLLFEAEQKRTDRPKYTCQRIRGVPLGMSRIHPECLDAEPSDRSVAADVLLRQAPDEEEDEEEDEGDGQEDDDAGDGDDDGYSE
jgi:hypothetical protein